MKQKWITFQNRKCQAHWIHWWISPNVKGISYTNSWWSFFFFLRVAEAYSLLILRRQHYPYIKIEQTHYKKIEINIFRKHRYKNSQLVITKSNPKMYKINIYHYQMGFITPMNFNLQKLNNMTKHFKILKKKSHNHFIRWISIESIWQISAFIHDKNFQQY